MRTLKRIDYSTATTCACDHRERFTKPSSCALPPSWPISPGTRPWPRKPIRNICRTSEWVYIATELQQDSEFRILIQWESDDHDQGELFGQTRLFESDSLEQQATSVADCIQFALDNMPVSERGIDVELPESEPEVIVLNIRDSQSLE